ncbi:hypothetical protein [Paracoccus saliphilus]|uniref:Transposase DDE domain-containing protein n=1 Tax=Paracoccus saliphilus TaxID=405559 RepID=A0AA46A5G1_9RHOB|nr:hypothetical protein [Paracoccus saliphilus]SIS80254.1 hypothetical protein SAMN05421772_105103 [Paracoccus saliphilus]
MIHNVWTVAMGDRNAMASMLEELEVMDEVLAEIYTAAPLFSPLKGSAGEALFAVLCACGYNIRKLLAHLRALWLLILLIVSYAQPIGPCRNPVGCAA